MKKKLIIVGLLFLIPLCIYMIINIASIVFLVYKDLETYNINDFYNKTWNIKIPNSYETRHMLYKDEQIVLEQIYYKSIHFNKLIEEPFVEKINYENIESVKNKYSKLITELFYEELSEDTKIFFKELNVENLIIENNYYSLIEEKDKFLFLIMNSNNKCLYIMQYKNIVV